MNRRLVFLLKGQGFTAMPGCSCVCNLNSEAGLQKGHRSSQPAETASFTCVKAIGRVCKHTAPAQRICINALAYSPYQLSTLSKITALSSSKMAEESENTVSEAAEKK